jgi:hypothetical protein
MIPVLLLLALQSADRLPPANPVPYSDPAAASVMAPIDAMFRGLAAHDGAAILAQVRPEGGATVALEQPDGTRSIRHLSWSEFTAGVKPGPDRLEEKMIDTAIEVDGDIAMVWGPYTFTVNGKVHHCGVNHFDLVRDGGSWKVLNVTWSQRTTGCAPS